MFKNSLQKVFGNPFYWFLSLLISVFLFVVNVLIPNFALLSQVNSAHGFAKAVEIAYGLILGLNVSTGYFPLLMILVTVTLFGINVSLLVYHIKTQKKVLLSQNSGLSAAGLILGIIGVGCASCGSLILFSLASFVGAGSFLSILPLGGEEFGLLGIALLLVSNYLILKKISAPKVC